MTFLEQQHRPGPLGSLDGDGAGDHDQPYRFGWRPRASAPYPPCPAQRGFNTRQFSRLLVMRSRFRDHLVREGEDDATSWPKVAA
jgi:hypothetical protein